MNATPEEPDGIGRKLYGACANKPFRLTLQSQKPSRRNLQMADDLRRVPFQLVE